MLADIATLLKPHTERPTQIVWVFFTEKQMKINLLPAVYQQPYK